MAQDITLLGANYPDVPAVNLPKTGGGQAQFDDTTDADATAGDILTGKTAYVNGAKLVGTNPGGSPGIPFGKVDSTSTSTAYTATVDGITELADGVCCYLMNGVVTSAAGFTLDINDLGAKPVYTNLAAATAETTKFNINYTLLFIYNEDRISGGCWDCYNGFDSNTNTIGYQLRTNSSTRPASDKGYRYRLWFTSADGTKWVPANKSTSTNATSTRTPNTTPIDPWGEIIYYGTNGTTEANANLSTTNQWQQYTLSLGYSFNTTGAALTLTYPAPVYIKCSPQTNGSATLQGYSQALPSTEDGYIYIYLGKAYSATNIELVPYHPVYYYKDGAIRIYTNQVSGGGSGGVSDVEVNGTSVVSGGVAEVTVPTKTSDLSNDSGFITGMTILSYGSSTWSDFITAYQANKVVYCRASSNANPGSGTQNRLAFMAYVNNAANPTEVEFQYYRSVTTHTDAQQGDQVFVYKLTSSGTWTVTTREAYTRIIAGSNITGTYANGALTLSASGGGGGSSITAVAVTAGIEDVMTTSVISGDDLCFWRLWPDDISGFPANGHLVDIDAKNRGYRIPAMYDPVQQCLIICDPYGEEAGFMSGDEISVICYFI